MLLQETCLKQNKDRTKIKDRNTRQIEPKKDNNLK